MLCKKIILYFFDFANSGKKLFVYNFYVFTVR